MRGQDTCCVSRAAIHAPPDAVPSGESRKDATGAAVAAEVLGKDGETKAPNQNNSSIKLSIVIMLLIK